MGKTFEELTWEELCDLMCGKPEEEGGEDDSKDNILFDTCDRNVGNRLYRGKV